MRLSIVVAVLLLASRAHAVELKNDGFQPGDTADFMGGFVVGEIGASRFVASSAGQQLMGVQFLFGGALGERTITLHVYDDSAGTAAPGTDLFSNDYQVSGSDMVLSQIDLSADNVIVPATFRIGIEFQAAGAPSIAADTDGSNTAGRNFIFAVPGGWIDSNTAAVPGDWVIRAEVSGGSPPGTPDAGPTGGGCLGNADCALGEYCGANMTCTFDCRADDDCSGGTDTCNSLGQCIDGPGDGSGCGCRAATNRRAPLAAGLAAALLAIALAARRRRR